MERVVVSRMFFNVVTMQVCAVADASDEEILEVCNRENPCGTKNGWTQVIRETEGKDSLFKGPNKTPVDCEEHEGRKHFLVLC